MRRKGSTIKQRPTAIDPIAVEEYVGSGEQVPIQNGAKSPQVSEDSQTSTTKTTKKLGRSADPANYARQTIYLSHKARSKLKAYAAINNVDMSLLIEEYIDTLEIESY